MNVIDIFAGQDDKAEKSDDEDENAIFGGTQISQGSGIPEVPCNNMSDDLTRPTASDSNIANKKKKPKMFKMFKKLKKSKNGESTKNTVTVYKPKKFDSDFQNLSGSDVEITSSPKRDSQSDFSDP